MDPFESIKQTFFQECDELLTDAEQGLLAMEAGDADSETINAVFRAVHSVKGGAGAFGLDELIRFAHVFETVMDELRSAKMELTDEVAKVLLRAFDVLADHVAAARDGTFVDEARSAGMLSELKGLIGDEAMEDDALGEDEDFGFVPMTVSIDDDAAPAAALDLDLPPPIAMEDLAPAGAAWIIEFAPKSEMYAKANEAGLVLRELARLGATEVTLDDSALPPLDQLAAETAYISWTVRLTTDADEAAIREVFEFVEDDCALSIRREGAEAAPAAETPAAPASDDDLAKVIRQIARHGQGRRYHHIRVGVNSRLDTLQAGVLLGKLQMFPAEVALRQQVAETYTRLFSEAGITTTPYVEAHNVSAWTQYTIRVPERDALQGKLKASGIPTAVHYPIPLNRQPAVADERTILPVGDRLAVEVINLPICAYLQKESQGRIVQFLKNV